MTWHVCCFSKQHLLAMELLTDLKAKLKINLENKKIWLASWLKDIKIS